MWILNNCISDPGCTSTDTVTGAGSGTGSGTGAGGTPSSNTHRSITHHSIINGTDSGHLPDRFYKYNIVMIYDYYCYSQNSEDIPWN